jgi:hypothetical protein
MRRAQQRRQAEQPLRTDTTFGALPVAQDQFANLDQVPAGICVLALGFSGTAKGRMHALRMA